MDSVVFMKDEDKLIKQQENGTERERESESARERKERRKKVCVLCFLFA